MAKTVSSLLPSSEALLREFGARLRLARLRRKLTAKQVAERAGMAPMTFRAVERGGSGVTIGAYLAVMQVLGLEQDVGLLAKADVIGREIQDIPLHAKSRRGKLPVRGDSNRQQDIATAPSDRIASMIVSLPMETLLERLNGLPLHQLRKVLEQLPSTRLKEVVELLPSEQLKKIVAALPGEQIKNLLNESPSNRLKQLLEQETKLIPSIHSPPSSSSASSDWIERGGFSSSAALADLISSVPPASKKVR